MTQRSLSAKPPAKTRCKSSNDPSWGLPRITEVEKAARHRKTQAVYRPLGIRNSVKRSACEAYNDGVWGSAQGSIFWRNVPISAAAKAAKWRREPPKYVSKTPSVNTPLEERHDEERPGSSSTQARSESPFTFQDYRATDYFILDEVQPRTPPRAESELPGVGSGRYSPTPDERLACDALTALAQRPRCVAYRHRTQCALTAGEQCSTNPQQNTDIPALHVSLAADKGEESRLPREPHSHRAELSWVSANGVLSNVSPFQDAFIDSTFTELPPSVAPLTATQAESLRATGAIGLLTPVQAAQMQVATLNARELTPPTTSEAAAWLYQRCAANWGVLDHTRGFEIIRWRTGILKAERRARLAGEVFVGMPQWTGLDDGLNVSVVESASDTSVEAAQTIMLPQTTIPTKIARLTPAPVGFTPCRLNERFGENFSNHKEFSRKRNKRYWVLFVEYSAVYTLKVSCMAAKAPGDAEKKVVGCFEHWGDVLRVWAAYCFHHHKRCERHAEKCRMTACPRHPGPDDPANFPFEVDDDVKEELREQRIKREASVGAMLGLGQLRKATPGQAYGHHYTRRGSADSDNDATDRDSDGMPLSGPPLYDPDTPPRESAKKRAKTAPPAAPRPRTQSPPTSATVSSASSLSLSSASTAGPSVASKGKGRAVEMPAVSSISQHRARAIPAPSGAPSAVSVDDAFYVGVNGSISSSTAGAFTAVVEGGVQVVYGFESAAALAREMAAKRKREAEEEEGMDVDAVAASLV
ncbi:hypothetical protein C8F04DRAFT_1193679 [Mycena alexandri]|uniref:Uncharacterized protein n=1 Tax=Mycena alexandri TaxID=1745969 RepID=A0AAD6S8X1_9AGAR|nr:hypothetical protein C8F04DRAFT_1193679 [Mycena alexandri]